MAAIFNAIFGCCCGERDKTAPTDTSPLLHDYDSPHGHNDDTMTPYPVDDERTLDLNQKVADIVSNGTGRMLSPGIVRPNGVYSPVLGAASSSQANIMGPRTPHTQRSQPESHHSSQSSRHSSYRQHQPSLVAHVESEGAPSEDAASALDALNNNAFSVTSNGGNKSRQEPANYGTMAFGGLGASATGRRFQIHRGRPPTRKRFEENNVVTSAEQETTQSNGNVQPSAELAHEVKQRPTSETSPSRAEDGNALSGSSPLRINRASNEGSSAERGPDIDEKRKVHFELPPGDLILHYD